MPRDAVSRTAHVGTVGQNGVSPFNFIPTFACFPLDEREKYRSSRCLPKPSVLHSITYIRMFSLNFSEHIYSLKMSIHTYSFRIGMTLICVAIYNRNM